jgi:hypothetical protein
MDYTSLLRATDRSSVAAYTDSLTLPMVGRQATQIQGDIRFGTTDIGSRNDANAVQASPATIPVKTYVVIDTSLRNWVLQPNPYSNLVYSFGSQSINGYSPSVYTNNSFVPTFGADSNGVLNTLPGLPNSSGWYLSNVFYPAYNSSLPKGNFLAYDTGYTIKPAGLGFGSVFLPSNVQSIRLVRALLPQRQFLNIPILVGGSDADLVNYGSNGVLQQQLANTPYSTFATYPYLLFNLNEYTGKYVGGNEAMRRAFSVMTQKTRTQTNFNIAVGVQHYDYEPWNEEALVFQSPITTLQQLRLNITDPSGLPFVQNDGLSVVFVQSDSNQLFIQCFTGASQYFNDNELRVGDRVIFDSATLSNCLKSTIITTNSDKVSFINSLAGVSFPVLQLLDYVTNSNGQFVPRTTATARTKSYDTSYNGFLIPNFLTSSATGDVTPTYPNAPDAGNSNILYFPIQYNLNPIQTATSLPFLNTALQPTYTLELTCLQPDTGRLGGKITQ